MASNRQITQDALLLKMGAPLVQFDPLGRPVRDWSGVKIRRPAPDSIRLSTAPLPDLVETYLRQIAPASLRRALSGMSRPQMVSLAMDRGQLSRYFPGITPTRQIMLSGATGDFPNLLADTLNKAVLSHYATARRSWRAFAKRGTIADMKEATRVRLDDAPALEELPEGASCEIGHLPENPAETLRLATYSRGFRVTRQAILNDDAAAFGNMTGIMAAAAYRLEDVLAYSVLTSNAAMADSVALFATAHNNLSTGALTTESLGAACAKIAAQQNSNGDVLDLQAARLIVPAGLKMTGEAVLDSIGGARRAVGEGTLSLVSSALLDQDSATQWYVACDPDVVAAVELAFLPDTEGPRINQRSHFDTDGFDFRVSHDLAAKAIDYRAIARSSGA